MKPVVTLALMMVIIPASLALADKYIRDNAGNLSGRSGITSARPRFERDSAGNLIRSKDRFDGQTEVRDSQGRLEGGRIE